MTHCPADYASAIS